MKMYDDGKKSFAELMLPFRAAMARYWSVSWAPAAVVFGLVLVLSIRLPNYYDAGVLIYVQPPKVNSRMMESTSKEDQSERLDSLVKEMLSGPRLRSIMEQFNLYPDYKGVIGKEKALIKFREAIKLQPVLSQSGKQLTETFLNMQFSHPVPQIALDVTKALSNLFIEESIVISKTETGGTVEFFDSQLQEARRVLEETESKVQGFVKQNFGKLPEHLSAEIARLENSQANLATNSQLITANVTRLGTLQQVLSSLEKEPAPVNNDNSPNDPEEALAQLQSALTFLLSKYTPEHPDVVNTKRRIESLKQQIKSGSRSGGGQGRASSPEARSLRLQIGEIEAQIVALKEDNKRLKATIDELESNIKEMPLKEQELVKINRDYANAKANYEKLSQARDEARLKSSMVSSQKGAQFKIIEPPTLPIIPSWPNRWLVAGIGLFVSLLLFFIIPLGLYFLNSSYKFRDEVEEELGITVIGTVPPMQTPRAVILSRRAASASVIASILSFAAGCFIIFLLV